MLELSHAPQVFLHYYSSQPTTLDGSYSLVGWLDAYLFAAHTSFYKNFMFFKVIIKPSDQKYFSDTGKLKFPFYWTQSLVWY